MKFLLVFLIVLVLAWRWRAWRDAALRSRNNASASTPKITDMVVCRQCGVHIPADEAVAGLNGNYCSAAHRVTMEP